MDGYLLNLATTLMVVISFLMVVYIYNFLRKKVASEVARKVYTYLVIAWTFFTITYVFALIRNPIEDIAINIWINKIDTAVTAIGAAFLFMFLGELYGSKRFKIAFSIIGFIVASVVFVVYLFWPGFSAEASEFGVEVIPPSFVKIVVLCGILTIVGAFLFTAVYFSLKVEKPELKRKVIYVSISYIIFWIFQLMEAGGIMVEALGGIGIIITRITLVLMAFTIIVIWAGKDKFMEGLKSLFRR
ncbi:MAG: hypothetical protein Q6363_002205 [Candidatus Njordarchaeota archaeon]